MKKFEVIAIDLEWGIYPGRYYVEGESETAIKQKFFNDGLVIRWIKELF